MSARVSGGTFSAYYERAEQKRDALTPEDRIIWVRVGEHYIRMHFQNEEQADRAGVSLTGMMEEAAEGTKASADFIYWEDVFSHYLPEGTAEQKGVWSASDGTGYMRLVAGYGLMGADYIRRRYYLCLDHTEQDLILHNHAMVTAFFRWAMQNDMIFLHSAAVGAAGNGILIGGRGGRGKSTLAVSCLFAGMDFVSDDYVLLSRTGPLRAMPLYRTVGLNQDMAKILQPDLPVLYTDPLRNGKMILDASAYPFTESLEIRAVLLPEQASVRAQTASKGETAPRFELIHPGQALTQIVYSSLSQLDVLRETDIVKEMTGRLLGLPVYKMYLSRDPARNAESLKEFLTGL